MTRKLLRTVRFDEPLETEFRAYFEERSQKSRAELWIVLLLVVAGILIFYRAFLQLPPEVVPLGKAVLLGILVPAILRGLSVRGRPFSHWATEFYIAAAFIDISCILFLRAACIRAGYDVVPLILPVAILLSLIAVQIRFLILVPVVLVGLACIVGVELWVFEPGSNGLFQLAAAISLVLVALTPAYAIEYWMRVEWRKQRDLNTLAEVDELTGLATRRSFEERFNENLRAARRSRKSVTLMILDVDRFKAYNDHFGHPAGDHCRNLIGNYLKWVMRRPQDFAARLGGEEFAVVWFDLNAEAAPRVAEELLQGIAELGIVPPPNIGTSVTASGGLMYAEAPPPDTAIESFAAAMVRHADQALYAAKQAGRNRVVVSELGTEAILSQAQVATAPETHDVGERVAIGNRAQGLLSRFRGALRFPGALESEFRAAYERQGRSSRRLILSGLLAVIVAILAFAIPVLEVPRDQYWIGAATLIFGLAPPTILALLGTAVPRFYRWSTAFYIGAVGVILAAQMGERVVQLQKGHDMVPFLMPISILLSLSVVQIRYGLMATSMLIGFAGVIGVELWAFELTSHRLLDVATATMMVGVTLSFAYKLERSTRLGWEAQRRLNERAHTDALTGLPNRRKFDAAFLKLIRTAIRERRGLTLMIFDIDHFKAYNDHFGHPAGDHCLKAVGQYIDGSMRRPLDFAARIGGEEFVAVWFDTGEPDAIQLAEKLRRGISELGIVAAPHIGSVVTASAGLVHLETLSECDAAKSIADRMIRDADKALYEAKSVGRDQLFVHAGQSRTTKESLDITE